MASQSSAPVTKRQKKNPSTIKAAEKVGEDLPMMEKFSPVVVLAHGAGAPSTSEWMIRWKKLLGEALSAIEVVTFDYPYISSGKRKAPPKAEKLVDYHMEIVKAAVQKHPGHPLVLAGKSMGSRVSCMVANAEDIKIMAVICLGYPLKGMNGSVRDEILLQLTAPTMFVQGSKDSLCPLDQLDSTRKKMKCINDLHVVDGGDHSFKVGKRFLQSTASNQEEVEKMAVNSILNFVTTAISKEADAKNM